MDEAIGRLDGIVSTIPDAGERKEFAKKLGDIIGLIDDLLIRSLVRQFPDLDPDK